MSPDKSEYLRTTFPEIFPLETRHWQGKTYEVPFSFDCGDGWYPLVLSIAEKIDAWVKENKIPIIATQVKEKFGGLRFYNSGVPNEVWDFIEEMECESFRICEACGKPGTGRGEGWIYTRCETCPDRYWEHDTKS